MQRDGRDAARRAGPSAELRRTSFVENYPGIGAVQHSLLALASLYEQNYSRYHSFRLLTPQMTGVFVFSTCRPAHATGCFQRQRRCTPEPIGY